MGCWEGAGKGSGWMFTTDLGFGVTNGGSVRLIVGGDWMGFEVQECCFGATCFIWSSGTPGSTSLVGSWALALA